MNGPELFVAAMTGFANGDSRTAVEMVREAPRDVLESAFIAALAGVSGTLHAVGNAAGISGDALVTSMMQQFALGEATA